MRATLFISFIAAVAMAIVCSGRVGGEWECLGAPACSRMAYSKEGTPGGEGRRERREGRRG